MTLVELLAASAATAGIMAGVLAALGPAEAMFARQSARVDATQRLRVGVETLTRAVRDAAEVAGGAAELTVRNGPDARRYYFAPDRAQLRVEEQGTDLPVLDGVRDLRFDVAAGGLVAIHLSVNEAGAAALHVSWSVVARNALPAP